MTEPLMIGTRGWVHADWSGSFYPPELPPDWCFCYYSNHLRSALVPREAWPTATRAEVEQWVGDSDPAFRFVLELPEVLSTPLPHIRRDRMLDEFLDTVGPIAERTAGLLLRIDPQAPVYADWFEQLLHRLSAIGPVCVDLPDGGWRGEALLAALDRQRAGLAWRCGREPAPRDGGRLLVALAPAGTPREVRHWIEQLAQWQRGERIAGLYFDVPAGAAKAAQEARIIAELMGV